MAPSRSHTSWPRRASSWARRPATTVGSSSASGRSRNSTRARSPGWVAEPGLVEAVVEQRPPDGRPGVGVERLELVQRVGGAAGPAGGRAQEGESLHPVRGGDGQLLGHHPPEADADHPGGVPPDGVQQAEGVGRAGGHPVGPGCRSARTQSPLVVGEQGDVPAQQRRAGVGPRPGSSPSRCRRAGADPIRTARRTGRPRSTWAMGMGSFEVVGCDAVRPSLARRSALRVAGRGTRADRA